MISKITGYSGFRTYGELAYPTKKQGKQLQDRNQIWHDTKRQTDFKNTLDNFNNAKSIYKASFLENTSPENYHAQHVVKGNHKTLNFAGTVKAYDTQQFNKASNVASQHLKHNIDSSNPIQLAKMTVLKTGTEHWRSNYQADCGNVQGNMNATAGSGWAGQSRGQSNGGNQNPSGSNWRTQSMDKNKLKEAEARANSYKNRPFMNHTKLGATQYKFNFGENIGDAPTKLMDGLSYKQPLRDNPLKHGTNQLWTEIPNYQGFKPAALSFNQIQSKIENRPNVDRGHQKLLLSENYHIDVPGYCGHKPKFQTTTSKIRENCFS